VMTLHQVIRYIKCIKCVGHPLLEKIIFCTRWNSRTLTLVCIKCIKWRRRGIVRKNFTGERQAIGDKMRENIVSFYLPFSRLSPFLLLYLLSAIPGDL
jgi:hypothetical protein